MKHYLSYFQDTVYHYWDKMALTDFDGTTSYTYGDVARRMMWLNLLFSQQQIKAGDKIAICGRNSCNWAVAFLASVAYKAVVVSILPEFTGDSIHELVNHSDARVLFVGPWVRGKINCERMPNVDLFVAIEDMSVMSSKIPVSIGQIDELFATTYKQGFSPRCFALPTDNMDDVAVINYTSGSTGSPKGVMLTHRNLSSNVVFGQENIPNNPSKSIVSMLPLAHMFGLMFELLYQLAGGTRVYFLTKSLTPALLLRAFHEVKPYMILTVPLVVEKIFKRNVFPVLEKPFVRFMWSTPLLNLLVRGGVRRKLMEAFGGHLEYLIIGGAALNQDVEQCMHQIHFPYTCGYGMTECAPIVCYAEPRKYVFRSCGKVVDRMQLMIDSSNPRKVEGEILVKGDNVMRGYYKNLQATDNIFNEDGWMRTGDIGVVDRRGNVFLRGRSKNVILGASGQNIYPEEIEDQLNSLEGVAESVIVERDGKLVGLVFPESMKDMDWDHLKQLMAENLKKLNLRLPSFSKVSDIELVDKEFEKTPKHSIKRFLYK